MARWSGCGSPTAGGAWLRTRTVWVQIPPAAPKDWPLAFGFRLLAFGFWLPERRAVPSSSRQPGARTVRPWCRRRHATLRRSRTGCDSRRAGHNGGLRVRGSEFRAPARKPFNPELGTRDSQLVVRGCSAWEPNAAVNRVPVGATEVRFLTPPLAESGSGFRVQDFELRRPLTRDSKPETRNRS